VSRIIDITVAADVLARAREGESAAQASLYVAFGPSVMGLIRRLVPVRAAAEDLFQDTMLAVFEHLPQFRGDAPLGAWVRQIAVTRCFMYLRSPWQRSRMLLQEDFEPALQPAHMSELIDLDRALAQLPPTARSVLWLCEVEGYTHEEIARGFGRSVSFSKSQLARAHRRLASLLQADGDEPAATLIKGPLL
jgi:RNA polymerase sigma-70 factor (ECF subfamily)